MHTNISPTYLIDLILQLKQTTHVLRNSSDIPSVRCRTQSYKSSFLPSTIQDWNALPEFIKSKPTLQSFKIALYKNSTKPSPLYQLGTRTGQILHAQLRLGCSALNFDLHRKNIVESPLCACGAVETASHYLLHCPNYQNLRQQLLSDIPCPPLLNNLLYGDEKLTYLQNKTIVLRVQKFIVASKRFSA